ncbi:MAG: GAF domain-containing SpoIIE family protein phosphatase [Melioribacteraceae bacterium]
MAGGSTVELSKGEYNSLLSRLKFFQSITREISERKPLQQLLDEIISSSKKLLDAEAASLLLFSKNELNLYFHTVSGGTGISLKSRPVEIGEGIAGWVAEKRESLIINDCYSDARFNKNFDISSGFQTKRMVCVPMINKEELVGVIQVINKKNNSAFTNEDLQIFEALALQCAVAIENARLIEIEIKSGQTKIEMDTAWKIQQNFLPRHIPSVKDVEISIKLKSAKEIGGDYFNVIKINEEITLFFVGDVAGKSIPAALIVSTLFSFLQIYFIISKENFNTLDFVHSFNRFLVASTTADKFVTAWFGFYDRSDKTLTSINAGHNPVYIIRDGSDSIEELSAGGLMLGAMEFPYISEKLELRKNDLVVFYTDGIPEAMNNKEEEFGEDSFKRLLLLNKNLEPDSLSKLIFDELKLYRGEAEQSDDITLGILKIR